MKLQNFLIPIFVAIITNGCSKYDISNSLQNTGIQSVSNVGHGLAILFAMNDYNKNNPTYKETPKESIYDENGNFKETGTKYNKEGYDARGFDINGINKYTKQKYNILGFAKDGQHKNGTMYDADGRDMHGEK